MAETLTLAANPPFAADAVLDTQTRLAVVAPLAAHQAVVAAPLEVSDIACFEADAVAAQGRTVHPDLASLHVVAVTLYDQAKFDPSARRMLAEATAREAHNLGMFVAASAVDAHIASASEHPVATIDRRIHEMAEALLLSQGADYDIGSRGKVVSEAMDYSLDDNNRAARAAQLLERLMGEFRTTSPEQVASDAMVYWAGEASLRVQQEMDRTRERLKPPVVKESGMTPAQLFREAPEFVAAVLAGAEVLADAPDMPNLELYKGGIRRAIAYISLVTAKTASGEWCGSQAGRNVL